MSSSFTYAELLAAVEAWEEEEGVGSDLSANFDTMVGLAEIRILRDLNLEIFDIDVTGLFTIGNNAITKPADWVATRSLYYTNTSGDYVYLERKTDEYIRSFWPNPNTQTATVDFFTEFTDTQWKVGGTPSTAYTWTARYMRRPTQLASSGSTDTWLSKNVGDLLFYACLIEGDIFLLEDIIDQAGRIQGLQQQYAVRLIAASEEFKHLRRADYDPVGPVPQTRG